MIKTSKKEKWNAELIIANKELIFQNEEKDKRAAELVIANKELIFQNKEKEKRAAELIIANEELNFQNEEKEKRAAELVIANEELNFQNEEKEKRAAELVIANEELNFQNKEKEKRATELVIANKELIFQNEEKEKRAAELIIANEELNFQNEEKEKRAAELIIANEELNFQNKEKEKRAAELVIANKELMIAATVFESQEGMLITDASNRIIRVNSAFASITGYSNEDVIGQKPSVLSSEKQSAGFFITMWDSINNTGAWQGEIYNTRKNGEIYPEYITITAVKDAQGIVTNYVETLTDITLIKASADKIISLAYYDVLTHLPNRSLLLDRLEQALTASAESGQRGAVLCIDLDHFKNLNDTLGHDMGDLLLKQVAERLIACIYTKDTIARIGGDEFVIILENLSDSAIEAAAETNNIIEKIAFTLSKPYQLNTHFYQSSSSIGATLFMGHELKSKELLKQADIAMYQSKGKGRNAITFFNSVMQDKITARVDIENELRVAIEQQQFQLHYQIQVDHIGRPFGAEALIRWPHPKRGLISPLSFIPVAEDTGLIITIGQWVLETACAQLNRWDKDELTRYLTLSVNVSAKQFFQTDFAAQVIATVRRYDINPTKLKLELTESMLVESIENFISTINTLKEIGIKISLDDFGTGYSSLQYLKKLGIYQLKIDQSFVRDIATDIHDQVIVRTIIAMAHSLDINVVVEGVETEEQRQVLLTIGCSHFQGYLFSKPVHIDEFEGLVRKL
ncbi:EAL domain-containing protein [Colwellia sp. BRX10-5]|uniref:putative bifunctional diguanylate cyclase/phosphodiesterase n=1 Tax=Colwellia sp. BRX10-5 TaxID=2759842 RepID=UPI0028734CA1|nr:EAL domain-containing protein [Colwellia sp. BRX10-5]